MGRYKEIVHMVTDFCHSVVRPVHWLHDVPAEFALEKKVMLNNNVSTTPLSPSMTVALWNILRNYNQKQIRHSLQKIIQKYNPELILLQEVPVYTDSTFWQDELYAGYNIYFAPSHQVKRQSTFYNFLQTGQLTLARFPFTDTASYPLPTVARRSLRRERHIIKRLALYTQFTGSRGTTVGVYNIHLENAVAPPGRKKQLASLLKIINEHKDDAILIAGDFNTFLGVFEGMTSFLGKAGFNKLGTRIRFIPRLDHFFLKGMSGNCRPVAGHGSDHRPFVAHIQLD